MTRYARVTGGRVTAVYNDPVAADIEALGLVPLPDLSGLPTKPSADHELRIVGGVPQWADTLTLAEAKARKGKAIKAECVTRAQAIYEGIDSYATLDLFVGLWTQGLSAGAKNPQGDWATLLQTVQAARQAIASVRAATTVAQVGAVVVQWPQ